MKKEIIFIEIRIIGKYGGVLTYIKEIYSINHLESVKKDLTNIWFNNCEKVEVCILNNY